MIQNRLSAARKAACRGKYLETRLRAEGRVRAYQDALIALTRQERALRHRL